VIGGEDQQVDSLTNEEDKHLTEANHVSLSPTSELPGVIRTVLHHVETLLGLTCQSDMHDEGANKSANDSRNVLSWRNQILLHICVIFYFSGHVYEQSHLGSEKQIALARHRHPLGRKSFVRSRDALFLFLFI